METAIKYDGYNDSKTAAEISQLLKDNYTISQDLQAKINGTVKNMFKEPHYLEGCAADGIGKALEKYDCKMVKRLDITRKEFEKLSELFKNPEAKSIRLDRKSVV